MAFKILRKNKPGEQEDSPEKKLASQIARLRRISSEARDKHYGEDWDDHVRRLYMMRGSGEQRPSFRPEIKIPELQALMLTEASDLADMNPKIFLAKGPDFKRDEDREKALQAQWRVGQFNLRILEATIWSLFMGNGYLEPTFDPLADNGNGMVGVEARDPKRTYCDPFAQKDQDMSWVILEDRMFIDQVRTMYPEQGWRVQPGGSGGVTSQSMGGLQLPKGPMTVGSAGVPATNGAPDDDGRVSVYRCYVRDYSVKAVKRTKADKDSNAADVLEKPEYVPVYPKGRLIVECEGVILFDDGNPIPTGEFPLVTVYGLPNIFGHLAPAPIRLTLGLQELAERMSTQTYENAVRLSNGVTFIYGDSEIDVNEYGGLPAEVHTISANSKPPEIKFPPPLPPQMVELPEKLLQKSREIQGFTEARRGQAPGGNVSAPLYDASVLQSQSMTKIRSRYLAGSIHRLARLVLMMMNKFYVGERKFAFASPEGIDTTDWPGAAEEFEKFEVFVDPGSVKPMSGSIVRTLVPILRQMHLIDGKTALEWLEVPNPDTIMERLGEEAKAAEQAKIAEKQAGIKPGGKK